MHLSWLDPHKMRKITVVGREKMVVFDDMELERKVTVYEKGPWKRAESYGEWQTRSGDITIPRIPTDEPLKLECQEFLRLIAGEGDRRKVAEDGARVVRALDRLTVSSMPEVHPTATVYPGTVLGEGVRVLENAVVGKQPALGPKSTAKRDPLPPTEIGDGTIVSTGAIVFAGSTIGAGCILGDQSCVRERVTIADDVVVGRGSLVENDTTIGSGTRIQAEAYVTAYSTLEEDVFIAPCVVTTNDNFMGRTEKRKALMKGPTIRRGARVGGGAILCPGVEIGEEAFVGAGAVVTKDVPARKVVVGSPARSCATSLRRSCWGLTPKVSDPASARRLVEAERVRPETRRRDLHLDVVPAAPARGEPHLLRRSRRRGLRGAEVLASAARPRSACPGRQSASLTCAPGHAAGHPRGQLLVRRERDAIDVHGVLVVVDRRGELDVLAPDGVGLRAGVVVRLVAVRCRQRALRAPRSPLRRRAVPSR